MWVDCPPRDTSAAVPRTLFALHPGFDLPRGGSLLHAAEPGETVQLIMCTLGAYPPEGKFLITQLS